RNLFLGIAFAVAISCVALAQDSKSEDKHLDIQSSAGDLHIGKDADAKKAGLPLYPGARVKPEDGHDDNANLGISSEGFGMKLVVASYVSDDAPSRIIDFYRAQL